MLGAMHRASAALAIAAISGCATARVPSPAAAPAPVGLRFIDDDYDRALAEAKARKLPLFVDAWAPW
jgi:hypothetical protein